MGAQGDGLPTGDGFRSGHRVRAFTGRRSRSFTGGLSRLASSTPPEGRRGPSGRVPHHAPHGVLDGRSTDRGRSLRRHRSPPARGPGSPGPSPGRRVLPSPFVGTIPGPCDHWKEERSDRRPVQARAQVDEAGRARHERGQPAGSQDIDGEHMAEPVDCLHPSRLTGPMPTLWMTASNLSIALRVGCSATRLATS